MPTKIVKCPSCGHRFPDNHEKHKDRPKLSPCCLAPYTKTGTWKPNVNWLKEKRLRRDVKKTELAEQNRQRHEHSQETSDRMQDEYDRRRDFDKEGI